MFKEGLVSLVVNGSLTSLSIKIGGAAAAYFVQVYIASNLGAEKYGLYSVVLTLISFSVLFALLGLNTASVKLISRYRQKNNIVLLRKYLDISLAANLVASFFMALLIFASAVLIKRYFGLNNLLIVVLVIMIPLESLLVLLSSYFQGAGYVGVSQLPIVLLRPVFMGLFFVVLELSSMKADLPSLMLVVIFISVILIIVYIYYMKKLLWIPSFKKKHFQEKITKLWLLGSLPFVAISFFNILLNQLDILMISNIQGNTDTGIYTAAVKVSGLAVFILTSINFVIAPVISGLYAKRDLSRLAKMLSITAKLTTLGALVVLVILTLYGEDILLMFGKEFSAAREVLIILLVSQIVNIGSGSVGFLLNMSGRQMYSVKALALSSVVNIIANAFWIPRYGIEGAAYATLISTMVWNLYLVFFAYKELGINTTVFSTGRLKAVSLKESELKK